jgi:hypothetical protein
VQVLPVAGFPSDAVFAEAFRLESFAGRLVRPPNKPGEYPAIIELWLDWQAMGQVEVPYYFSFIAIAPDDHPEALNRCIIESLHPRGL